MSDLTILVTENPTLAGIPAALRDWSAAGLIRPFVWVPPATPNSRLIEARLVESGDVVVSSLGDLLARRSPRHVRIVALTSELVGGADSARNATSLAAAAGGAGGEIRTTLVQLAVTRLEARDGALTALEGWHNILISPDDAAGPTKPHTLLEGPASDEDIAQFALPAVAAVGALFDGVEAGPLDDTPVPPGATFQVLRVFARRLDGSTVRDALQRQTLGLTDGYPLVLGAGGASATYVENIDLANLDMANGLWSRHLGILRSARQNPQLAQVESLGIWKAFRMLWSFLWASIKNAPAEWANKVIYTGKQWVATTATRAIFGQNSAFAVVVGGVRGQSASWQTQVEALGALENSLGPAQDGHHVHSRMDSLWQDLVSGGLTLLDGQPRRGDQMDAAKIGSDTGIIRFGRFLAPSRARDSFTDIPGAVRAATETDELAPYDTLQIRRFGTRLSALAADPIAGADASATMEKFQAWWRRVSATYTTKVSLRLSDEFERRLAEIAEYTAVLQAAQATTGIPDDIRHEQNRLASRLRFLLIALVLLIAATITLGALAVIPWLVAGIALGVWVLGWLVSSVLTFLKGQRRLFQLKNMRAEALSKADAAEYNLAAAIRDARRCGDAYALLLQWAESLAIFASDPLGQASAQAGPNVGPGTDHPLAIQFGQAEVNDREVARAASALRRQFFPVGWLDSVWDAFLGSAGHLLGARGTMLLDEPALLYRQRAIQEDVLLPRWVEALTEQGVPGTAGDQTWERIVHTLQTTARDELERLLGQVRTETGAPTALNEFLGGLTAQVITPTGFPTTLFSASAITGDLMRPHVTWCREWSEGLSRTVVLAQISVPMPAEYLRPEARRHEDPIGNVGSSNGGATTRLVRPIVDDIF